MGIIDSDNKYQIMATHQDFSNGVVAIIMVDKFNKILEIIR